MPASRVEQLTTAQRECLRLVLTRHSSKEIAVLVGVSPSAVDKRIERAVQVLGVSNRFAAARALAEYEVDLRTPARRSGEAFETLGADAGDELEEHEDRSEVCAATTPGPMDSPVVDGHASTSVSQVPRWSVSRLFGLTADSDKSGDVRNPLSRLTRLGVIVMLMLTLSFATMALLNIGQTLSTLLGNHVRTGGDARHRSGEQMQASAGPS